MLASKMEKLDSSNRVLAEAGEAGKEDTMIFLRVKRKRSEKAEPPEFLILPHGSKRNKQSLTIEESLSQLSFDKRMKTVGMMCKLIDSQTTNAAFNFDSLPAALISSVSQTKKRLRDTGSCSGNDADGRTEKNQADTNSNNDHIDSPSQKAKRIKIIDLTSTSKGITKAEKTQFSSITLNGKPLNRLEVQDKSKAGSKMKTETGDSNGNFNPEMDEAVWLAFYAGNFEKVLECVNKGFDVNYRRSRGDCTTALMAAAYHGNLDVVKLLLKHGAKCDLADSSGKMALDFLDNLVDENLKSNIEMCLMESHRNVAFPNKEHDDDVMYDIYCVKENKVAFDGDTLLTKSTDGAGVWSPCDAHGWGNANVEVVDSTFDDLYDSNLIFDDDEEQESVFDNEEDDSNDENYYRNDYPDEDEEEGFYNESCDEDSY